MSEDVTVMTGSLLLFIQGVADCLQVAATRGNAVNSPVLSTTVRPALEIAGQIAWLVDDSIDAASRARRYMVWRLADLRSRRLLLADFRLSKKELDAALADLDREEEEMRALAEAARWQVRPTLYKGNGDLESAALLSEDLRVERMPKIHEMVQLVSSTPAMYGFLSVSSHGDRFGAFSNLEAVTEKSGRDGRVIAKISGFGLPANLVVGLACLAAMLTGRRLAAWNGTSAPELEATGRRIMKAAGIGK